jgi:2,5-diketo-D-gluconate reductase B
MNSFCVPDIALPNGRLIRKFREIAAMNVVEAKGAHIPAIGFGTLTLKDAGCVEAVKTALRVGYRHIDTAERYGNEAEVGEGLHQGLAATALKREQVFVTTKVYHDKLRPPTLRARSTRASKSCACPGSTSS